METEKEYGRLSKSDSVDLVVKFSDYEGNKGIDIREFITTPRFTGWSKSGTKIPLENWEDFKRIINSVDAPR